MCLVVIFLFFLVALIISIGEESPGIAIVIGILILGGFCLAIWLGVQQEKQAKAKAELARKEKEDAIKRRKRQMENLIDSLRILHGNPTKIIKVDDVNVVTLFAAKKIVCINTEELLFDSILSIKLIDDYQIRHGKVTSNAETKTDSASLIGRSAAGAVVAGGAGALIGASSASKETTTHFKQENDKVIHDYTLLITLKTFESSLIKIRIGNNWEIATELEQLFLLIIKDNN